jgi:SHS2 domain-containing protein
MSPFSSSRPDPHFAEWKVTITADTMEELFVEAAQLVGRQCGRTSDETGPWRTLRVSGSDQTTLLVDWLNELIGLSESERRAFGDVRALRLYDTRVTADIRGRPVVEWTSPLKSATLRGLRLEREGPRWKAEVRFEV